ncbi:MAG: hypothetical protein AAFX87_00320 [Bacteroidota bacterium]
MRRNYFILMLLVFSSSITFGQSYTFKVLANKGSNEVKTGGQWQPLRTGASLDASDELKVSENAYLGLVHASGRTMELKTPGSHKVADLASKLANKGSSVASKYADFVLSKMSADSKKNKLIATGATERKIELSKAKNNLKVYMPKSVVVFNDENTVEWTEVEGDQTYVVEFSSMFEDEILKVETKEPSIQLDLASNQFAKENAVIVQVSLKDDASIKSKKYAIKRLKQTESDRVENDLKDLMTDVSEQTALNKYILAGFYEENNLIVDALTSYREAMELAPDVESYREAYEEFLIRNKLN